MEIPEFIQVAKDHNSWFKNAKRQREIGNLLWSKFQEPLVEYGLSVKKGSSNDDLLDTAISYLSASQFHYGLSLENALKGYIIKKYPDKLEFEVNEQTQNVRLKKIGVKIERGHELHELAQESNILINKDENLKLVLQHLSDMIKWGARYPIPVNLKKKFDYSSSPFFIYGIHLRDYIDPVLDKLLSDKSS